MVLEYSEYSCRHNMDGFGYCDKCPIEFSCNNLKIFKIGGLIYANI